MIPDRLVEVPVKARRAGGRRKPNDIVFPRFHSAQRYLYDQRTTFDVWRCGRRFGKALALDTPLPTPTGWTTMGAVKEGDWLLDESGRPTRVVFATEIQFGRPCNVVQFSDGSSITADDDHLWVTWDKCARKNFKRNKEKHHAFKKPVNQSPKIRDTKEIRETLVSGLRGDANHSIECAQPLDLPDILAEMPPYTLGAWLGDGLSDGNRFVCNDPEILLYIADEGVPVYRRPQPYMWALDHPRHRAVGKYGTTKRLKSLGVLKNKHIPKAYLRASFSQRLALMQGLMDTDGTVSAGGSCEYTSISLQLAFGVWELALTLGIRAVLKAGEAKLNGRSCGAKYRVTFTTSLPVFKLTRKLDRLLKRKSDRNITHRFITGIRPTQSVPVKCIQVDSPSHMYLAGRAFIPTHNTTELEVIAGETALAGGLVGWFSPTYKLLLPSYKRILRTVRPLVAHSSKVDSIIETQADGCVEFWTLSDEDAGRSRHYDLVIIDEGSLVKRGLRETWEQAIAPTLLDRGGRAIMAGTPKGIDPENFFYQACTDKLLGFTEQHMPTHRNPKLNAERLAQLPDLYPPLVYMQEYLAEFVDWNGAAVFALDKMLVNGQGVDFPDKCDYVFATIDTAVKDGQQHDSTAVTFWARNQYYGIPLVVLDWDIIQIEGASLEEWLPWVFKHLESLAASCGARRGSAGAWIEDKASGTILLQRARKHGWPAQAIDSELTAVGKEERALDTAGYVHQGQVKLTQHAHDKRKRHKGQEMNHWESQVCGFRIGQNEEKRADDLLDTATYGMAIALGNSEGY